jgi:uncharacterized membrane protein
VNKSRLEAFSDGVVAIAITIMVLNLKIPRRAFRNCAAAVQLPAELHLRRHILGQSPPPDATGA